MKTKITALAISVIMMCSMMSSCGKKEIQMHTYEAIVNGEAFKLTYPVASDEENLKTEEEMVEIDVAAANAVADALFMFSEENSAGVGEINKSVDAVFDCSEKLIDLLNYTYSVSTMTGGRYQPVLGTVTDLYKSGAEITDEALAEALTHTGMDLISIDENSIIKTDRCAKLDYESISAGYALADAAAVLSVNGVEYAVLTYMNTVATFGQPLEKEKVDVAVYCSSSDENYHGVLSFNNSVVTTCNKESFVIDSSTGRKFESSHDTVVVISNDGILSNALAPVLYGMSTEDIQKMYNSRVIKFEAVVIDENGDVYTTSEAVEYRKNISAN